MNEFAPEIRSITSCGPHVRSSNMSTAYVIEANIDELAWNKDNDHLAGLVRIDATDRDDPTPDSISMRIDDVRVTTSHNHYSRFSTTNSPADDDIEMNALPLDQQHTTTVLFSLDLDKRVSVYLDELRQYALSHFEHSLGERQVNKYGFDSTELPLVIAFITVSVEDKGELSTKINFVIVLTNNRTRPDELKRLDRFMSKRFADNWQSLRLVEMDLIDFWIWLSIFSYVHEINVDRWPVM